MKLSAFLLLLITMPGVSAFSQTTGSFDANITMNGQSRTLSFYVPINYDPANAYGLMVGLHGAGDNSGNYRNALMNTLGLNTVLPNTIFVFPDGGSDQSRDFYSPAGDEAIIDSAISYAMANYNINSSDIVLQGFSLGGRSALKYGLDNPTSLKGLMLHTPAVQGVKDALTNAGLNYANASLIPIYITHGGTDIIYGAPIDTAFEKLVMNDGIVRLERYPTLGHTIPPLSQIPDFTTWLDSPVPTALDVDLVKVTAPARLCVPQLPLSVLVRNTGSTPVTSIEFEYKAGTAILNHTWTGNIGSYQHAVVSLPPITADPGLQNVIVAVVKLNTNQVDTVTANNQKIIQFEYVNHPYGLPHVENFEGTTFPPAGWVLNRAGDAYSVWDIDNTVAQAGINSMFAFNTVLLFDNSGRREEILSPVVNLQSMPNPGVSFDVSYNYHRYTPPYLVTTTDFADTLEVYISTDCGDSFQRIYKKGGADLATFSQPIVNALNLNTIFGTPADSNWRMESIDLTPYAGSGEAIVKFSYVSALGGFINIDNVRFHNTLGVPEVSQSSKMEVYPNPAKDWVTIDAGTEVIKDVVVMDLAGRIVQEVGGTGSAGKVLLNTSSLVPGYYMIKSRTDKSVNTSKVLVER